VDQINVGQLYADLTIVDNTDKAMIKARDAMKAISAELKRLEADYNRGGISILAFASASKELSAAMQKLASGMAIAHANTSSQGGALALLNAKLAQTKGHSSGAAHGMMQLGYIADDLQYGLQSVVNNVGPLVTGLGMGMGLAGVIQVVAVGANILYNNWDRVKSAFGDTTGIDRARESIDGMQESIRDLSGAFDSVGQYFKNPLGTQITAGANERLRQDVDALGKMKAADKVLAQMSPEKTEAEKADTQRFIDSVRESGSPEKIARKLADSAIANDGVESFMNKGQAEQYGKVGGLFKTEMAEAAKRRADKQFMDMIGSAANDPQVRRDLALKMSFAGMDAEAQKIEGMAPTEVEIAAGEKENAKLRKAQFDDAMKANEDDQKESARRLKARQDDAEKANEDDQKESERRLKVRKDAPRKAAEIARAIMPGIGSDAESGLLGAVAANVPMSVVTDQIKRQLVSQGMDPAKAQLAAEVEVGDARSELGKKIGQAAMGAREISMSQTLAASDLTRQAQSGVSSDDTKQWQDRVFDQLTEIARNGKNVMNVRVE
jgi:hypothetical protein